MSYYNSLISIVFLIFDMASQILTNLECSAPRYSSHVLEPGITRAFFVFGDATLERRWPDGKFLRGLHQLSGNSQGAPLYP